MLDGSIAHFKLETPFHLQSTILRLELWALYYFRESVYKHYFSYEASVFPFLPCSSFITLTSQFLMSVRAEWILQSIPKAVIRSSIDVCFLKQFVLGLKKKKRSSQLLFSDSFSNQWLFSLNGAIILFHFSNQSFNGLQSSCLLNLATQRSCWVKMQSAGMGFLSESGAG
jgi:hypothetical protein